MPCLTHDSPGVASLRELLGFHRHGDRDRCVLGEGQLGVDGPDAEAIGALLRRRRWDCRMLGARTPVDSLGEAVEATNAAAVVVTCQITAGLAAVDALRKVERRRAHLFYAGRAFVSRRAREGVPGRYLGTNLVARAADLMTDTLTSPGR